MIDRLTVSALAAVLVAAATGAEAHPHVFVDAKVEIVFDNAGRLTAVRNIWQFDPAFTAFAVQGLDANDDGELSDEELAPLAKVNVQSLAEFDFFTFLTVGGQDMAFAPPSEYWLAFHSGRLTLFYTLPVEKPAAIEARATVEVFDPEYFVAFDFVRDGPVTLDGAPDGCSATYRPPGELDARTAAILSQIPADQREIPRDLREATSVLANLISVNCR